MTTLRVAGGVITDDSSRILLLHRRTPRPRWELPGGKIERGERPEQAVRRELREELGVAVAVGGRLGGCEFTEAGRSVQCHWYEARITGGEPFPGEAEFDGLRFFTHAEAAELWDELSPNARHLMAWHRDNGRGIGGTGVRSEAEAHE
ncbi:NUDIX hydrolase [Actinomadura sp.]|uniref:NUDIX hydrolase n=1 Tax=Actinomadura sp. TaxID=1989 RepID=UPI0037C9DECD